MNREFMEVLPEKRTPLLQEFLYLHRLNDRLKKIVTSRGIIVLTKRVIPGVGHQAHLRDPEGNVIGILENDPSAR